MTNKVADRVEETSVTTGTGTYTLAGATAGNRAFSAAFSNADDGVEYCATDGINWEVGYGTYNANTLTRDTIRGSSSSGNAVNWNGNTKTIFSNMPAAVLALLFSLGTTYQPLSSNLTELAAVNPTAAGLALLDDDDAPAQKVTLGIGNVENVALSTWAGSSNITAVGTLASGTVPVARISGVLPTTQGGSGQDWSASSGIPLLTTGAASLLSSTGTGNVVRATSPALVTPALGAATYTTLSGGAITDSALTSGRVVTAGTAGLLQDSANFKFDGSTATVVGKLTAGASASDATNAARALNLIATDAVMRVYRVTSDLGTAAPAIEIIGAPAANTASGSWTTWWDIYAGVGDALNFRHRTGGTVLVPITMAASGKVGIMTGAPDKALEVNLGTASALRLTYNDADGSAATYMDTTLSSTGVTTFTGAGSAPDFSFAQGIIMGGRLRKKPYTVGTLPAGTQGDEAFVTDALAPAYLVAVAAGGAAYAPVGYNGAAWACS